MFVFWKSRIPGVCGVIYLIIFPEKEAASHINVESSAVRNK